MRIVVKESPYFYKVNNELRQAIFVSIDDLEKEVNVEISVNNDPNNKQFFTCKGKRNLLKVPVNCGKILEPTELDVHLKAGEENFDFKVSVGNIRPWTIYVAQDKHLDYGWKHPVEDVVRRINDLTDYYMDLNEERGVKFNFDCMLWFEEYSKARPEKRVKKLVELLKSGEFEAGAMYAVLFNGIMTEEELIQQLMPARRAEKKYGIKFSSAVPTEVPSMNWGLAEILSGAGIKHIVRGAYTLNNDNIKNREPIPLFYWEGPDGSRVLTKFDVFSETDSFGGYAEARHLHLGTYEDRNKFVEEAIERYQSYSNYPFDRIMLAGTGWDEYPFHEETVNFISWFNSQDWVYPKLIDCTWKEYWKDIEEGLDNGEKIPVLKGDWGSSWEEWPSQLAYVNSLYRRSREILLAAQSASALSYMVKRNAVEAREEDIYDSFLNLTKFCDHNIGGILPAEANDMRDRKITYVYNAMKKGSSAYEGSLAEIAENMASDKNALMVFNPLSWERESILSVVMDVIKKYRVIEINSGEEVPSQIETKGVHPEHYLSFLAHKVPAFGYRVYNIEAVDDCDNTEVKKSDNDEILETILENERFRLEVSRQSGGIVSIYDKLLKEELVDRKSPYTVNQFLYNSEKQTYSLNSVTVSHGMRGDLSNSLIVEGSTFRCKIITKYTIYNGIERIDIENQVYKQPSDERQSCHFVFPFNVPEREYHYDGTAAILKPGLIENGGDQLKGAGMGTYCGLYFADASNQKYGITLGSIDTHLYHFGSNTMGKTEGYIDPNNSVIYSVAMENYNHMDNCKDQGGQAEFSFRYSIWPHMGGFNAKESFEFAKGICLPMDSRTVRKKKEGILKPGVGSLLRISQTDNLLVSAMKVSDDKDGVIIRIREFKGRENEIEIEGGVNKIISAISTDLLEREIEILKCEEAKVRVRVPAWGLISVKLMF